MIAIAIALVVASGIGLLVAAIFCINKLLSYLRSPPASIGSDVDDYTDYVGLEMMEINMELINAPDFNPDFNNNARHRMARG